MMTGTVRAMIFFLLLGLSMAFSAGQFDALKYRK
ncbi:hypothetical protein OESDEN_10251 [Oesophagostomum dentatum]|uniref:Uncharacterized protein n=1 Tax=Oesophagostomum dentatum TaxID=61180 RepID=A0A0B1SY50_OESDE|nr:hypothetical protein OESDEN_10251 [Oesophagostomum dentatum]